MKTIINKESPKSIKEAIQALKDGKIIAFKTDTIYGLSCNAFNDKACEKIVEIKNRDNKPMNILIGKKHELNNLVEVPLIAKKIIKKFWAGSLTIIFKAKYVFSHSVNCGLATIGVRIPKDKLCLKILESIDFPIVSTSINLSGESPINEPSKIFETFKDKIDYILDSGNVVENKPSTIISVADGTIKCLREGKILFDDILNI